MLANLGMVFTRSFAKAGISKFRTFTHLRRWGLSYGKKEIYRDWDLYRQLFQKATRIKFVPKKYRPSLNLSIKSTEMMTRNYKYGVRVNLFDYRTNQIKTELRYVRSDRLLTRAGAEREALKGVAAGRRAGYYDVEDYIIEEFWQAG